MLSGGITLARDSSQRLCAAGASAGRVRPFSRFRRLRRVLGRPCGKPVRSRFSGFGARFAGARRDRCSAAARDPGFRRDRRYAFQWGRVRTAPVSGWTRLGRIGCPQCGSRFSGRLVVRNCLDRAAFGRNSSNTQAARTSRCWLCATPGRGRGHAAKLASRLADRWVTGSGSSHAAGSVARFCVAALSTLPPLQ